jgi:hypothetical protein
MPLFKVSVESQVPVSAIVVSSAPTEAEALAEVRLLQSRARVNWRRGLAALGAIQAPYEIWAQQADNGSFIVSLYAVIPIFALSALVAEDSQTVSQIVQDRQSSGLIPWTYRGVPVGDYRDPIPTYWSNQQPDIVTFTDVSLSASSVYPGQSVTLSATVSGEETPVGNLEFRDGVGNTVIVPTTLEADPVTPGIAHAQAVVVFPAGTYSVYAAFLGSDGYQASSSTQLSLGVSKIGTGVVITPPFPPIYAGQSVSLSAVVSNSLPELPKPTGTLTLFQGTTVTGSTQLITSSPLSIGYFSLGTLPPGVYAFTIQYEGDGIHDGSSNSVSGITVLQVPTSMGISVLGDFGFPLSAAVFSQPVKIYATVTSGVDGTIPTGTVTFKEGVTTIGVATLSPVSESTDTAAAQIVLTNFSVGAHSSLTAAYGGNASFAPSVSGSTFVVVSKANTIVNAYSTNTPTIIGQPAVFDATIAVQPPATVTPFQQYGVGGSVTYKDSAVVVVNFDGTGHAGRSISSLSPGTNEVGVTFNATAEYNSSFGSFPHVVSKADTVTHIYQFSPNPAAWYYSTTIVCSVTPVPPGSGTVTGSVNFSVYDPIYWGNLFLGSGVMMGGVAGLTFNWFIFISDNYLYTAQYVGDSNFSPSQEQQSFYGYGYYF